MDKAQAIIFSLFITMFSTAHALDAGPPPKLDPHESIDTFSEGYRMGQLTKFSAKGWFITSGEGELLLGNESTPSAESSECGDDKNPKTCTKQINPWLFSVDLGKKEVVSALNRELGNYVILHYTQRQKNFGIAYATDYRIEEVLPVNQSIKPEICTAPEAAGGGLYSNGGRVGRIVKVSFKGRLMKSYEAIVQIGNSGSQFMPMSVYDQDLANCLLVWLASGHEMKLTYNQSMVRNPLTHDTTYQIMKVEPVAGGLAN